MSISPMSQQYRLSTLNSLLFQNSTLYVPMFHCISKNKLTIAFKLITIPSFLDFRIDDEFHHCTDVQNQYISLQFKNMVLDHFLVTACSLAPSSHTKKYLCCRKFEKVKIGASSGTHRSALQTCLTLYVIQDIL